MMGSSFLMSGRHRCRSSRTVLSPGKFCSRTELYFLPHHISMPPPPPPGPAGQESTACGCHHSQQPTVTLLSGGEEQYNDPLPAPTLL